MTPEQMRARIAEIDRARDSARWAAHMGSARYRPVPFALYEEKQNLIDALAELEKT